MSVYVLPIHLQKGNVKDVKQLKGKAPSPKEDPMVGKGLVSKILSLSAKRRVWLEYVCTLTVPHKNYN